MGRLLAIDYGARRVGLALSDPLKMIASPYRTIIKKNNTNLIEEIERIIAEEDVFYTLPSSSDAKKLLNRFTQRLSSEERNTLNEIVEIKRKIDPIYGY